MSIKPLLYVLICLTFSYMAKAQTVTNEFYNVSPGSGNGIKFWNNHLYKIHLGVAAENKYGPVSSYSIKMNMNDDDTRGWTWGISGQTPVTGLNTEGKFQTEGWIKSKSYVESTSYFRSLSRTYYLGGVQYLHGDNNTALYYKSNNSNQTQIILRDKENINYGRVYGSGNGASFGLLDGDGQWSYRAVKDSYTSFHINNSEKMRIKSDGRVGIGTTNPVGQLAVTSSTGQSGIVSVNTNGSSFFPYTNGWSYLSGKGLIFRTNGNTEQMRIDGTGKVRIGSVDMSSSDYKLFVEKGILAEKVRVAVKSSSDWADYVFEEEYNLLPIADLENYVNEKKHLPNVPAAEEMVIGGLDVAMMDAKLLEKIEEAHLYIIELHNEIEGLKKLISDE